MRKFTTYPIGATWTCVDKRGKHGWIKLANRYETFEMWTYGWQYDDGSGAYMDWAMSYKSAKARQEVYGKYKRTK